MIRVVCCILAAAGACAAEPIDGAIEKAVAADARVHAAQRKAAVAWVGARESGVIANPELRLGQNIGGPTAGAALDVALRWAPPDPFTRDREHNARKALAQLADAQLSQAKSDVVQGVWKAWGEACACDLVVRRERRVAIERERLALIGTLIEAGGATVIDKARAELDLQTAVANKDMNVRRREDAIAALLALCPGWDPAELKLDTIPSAQNETPADPALADAVANAGIAAAEADAYAAAGKAWPWFTFVEIGTSENKDGSQDLRASVGIELPISDRGQAERRVADAAIESWRSDREAMLARQQAALAAARRVMASAREALSQHLARSAAAKKTLDALLSDQNLKSADARGLMSLRVDRLKLDEDTTQFEADLIRAWCDLRAAGGP
jgi:outer membrane protein TolC